VEIHSIGHGTRTIGEFIAILTHAGIRTLADVRVAPGSRRHPQFGAAALERSLGEAGIAYVHLAELGGRREPSPDSPHAGLRVAAFRGYADHMGTEAFMRGYARLLVLARRSPTVFMCAETLWWRCHRRLIADRLTVDGWTVIHLLDMHKAEAHRLTDAARVLDGLLVYDAGTLPLLDEPNVGRRLGTAPGGQGVPDVRGGTARRGPRERAHLRGSRLRRVPRAW
jgi:uncharacterized protein (DUF488 family)